MIFYFFGSGGLGIRMYLLERLRDYDISPITDLLAAVLRGR